MNTPLANSTLIPGLSGLRVVLGVCGGIAAYKSAELVRQLTQQGVSVQVVMTPSATQFVGALTFQALSGKPVHISQWPEGSADRGMPHIDLSRQCDFLLIAPCTAHSLAKFAHGFGENLLDNLVLARKCPMAIAPAMNVEMWNNPATRRNLNALAQQGVKIFGPGSGEQACGEVGLGRMLEPHEIVWELARAISPGKLQGKRALLTAGPTFEAIDPVRGLTNRSSGKMGYSLAQAAWLQGAEVCLVSGPTALSAPYGIKRISVSDARSMHRKVQAQIKSSDIFFAVAAVADFGIKNPATQKQKKTTDARGLSIEFELNPDILADVGHGRMGNNRSAQKVIGFAAETEKLDEYAQSKLKSKNADFIVGNLAQDALGADNTTLTIYSKNRAQTLAAMNKLQAALQIIDIIEEE